MGWPLLYLGAIMSLVPLAARCTDPQSEYRGGPLTTPAVLGDRRRLVAEPTHVAGALQRYLSNEELDKWLRDFAQRCSGIAKLHNIGHSAKGRWASAAARLVGAVKQRLPAWCSLRIIVEAQTNLGIRAVGQAWPGRGRAQHQVCGQRPWRRANRPGVDAGPGRVAVRKLQN